MLMTTHGFYLTVEQLARFLGVGHASLGFFLGGRSTEGCSLHVGHTEQEMFLQSLGIFRQTFGNRKSYLLLGVGPIPRQELDMCMNSPPGLCWCVRIVSLWL